MNADTTPTRSTRPTSPHHLSTGVPWTAERIRALGAATTLPTAAAVLGISRSQAYRLAATDTFPAPLIRAGSRIIVPVAGLLRLLLLDNPAPDPDGGRRLDPVGVSSVDATTPPPADYTTTAGGTTSSTQETTSERHHLQTLRLPRHHHRPPPRTFLSPAAPAWRRLVP
ncbi:hypothetical protein [Micromonospora radicis]|uniref:hypothetical protein n=1 Tax=Micromonospora radicis TaxID=1894971 RepID=UPI003898E575